MDTEEVHRQHEAHQTQYHRRQTPEEIEDMLTPETSVPTTPNSMPTYGGPTGGETTPPFGQGRNHPDDSWAVNKRVHDEILTVEQERHEASINAWIQREDHLMEVIRELTAYLSAEKLNSVRDIVGTVRDEDAADSVVFMEAAP